jgi:hypothetical protein
MPNTKFAPLPAPPVPTEAEGSEIAGIRGMGVCNLSAAADQQFIHHKLALRFNQSMLLSADKKIIYTVVGIG